MPEPPAIRVQGLTKTYASAFGRKRVRALVDFSLEVEVGEIFGLLGPNGAGKTTLVKMLLGIVRPTAGEASLFDVPVRQPNARTRIGFLPENHRFPDFLTAGETLDLYARLAKVPAAERKKRIPELLDLVRMTPWRDTKIRKFSKGMMQRLGLAQALMNAPDLLVLDEPTDGVDPIGRREIRDLIVRLRDAGTTIFLNSHLLSEVEQVCTRVAILNKGHLVRKGTVAELTAVDRVYELAATPIPAAVLASLGGLLTRAEDASDAALRRYRLATRDRAHLNEVIDALRGAGVEIEAVTPLRRSLEEYFIDVIESDG